MARQSSGPVSRVVVIDEFHAGPLEFPVVVDQVFDELVIPTLHSLERARLMEVMRAKPTIRRYLGDEPLTVRGPISPVFCLHCSFAPPCSLISKVQLVDVKYVDCTTAILPVRAVFADGYKKGAFTAFDVTADELESLSKCAALIVCLVGGVSQIGRRIDFLLAAVIRHLALLNVTEGQLLLMPAADANRKAALLALGAEKSGVSAAGRDVFCLRVGKEMADAINLCREI